MADRFPLIANSSANQIQELAAADQLNLTASNLIMGDSSGSGNNRIKFGTSGDLEIYHNGSHSYISNVGTGELVIEAKSGENGAVFRTDGAAELYYNGTKRLETTSSGANVVGTLTVNGSAIDTNLVTDTSPQLGGNLDANSKNIVFGDSSGSTVNRLTFGDGTDLSIRHDGTDTILSNATGDLYINNAGTNSDDIILSAKDDVQIKVQDGETAINCVGDGAVELYHNGTKQIETSSSGAKMSTGHFYPQNANQDLGLSNNYWRRIYTAEVKLKDSNKIKFGDDDDLEIYHDGSHARIENTTGTISVASSNNHVTLKGTRVNFENAAGSEIMLRATQDGAVELFHDNSNKLQTTSTGVNVTGALTINGSALSSGGLIQTVQSSLHNTSGSTSISTSYGEILSLSITPSSSSHKICVLCSSTSTIANTSGNLYALPISSRKLTRTVGGSETTLVDGDVLYQRDNYNGTKYQKGVASLSFQDSPSTTSTVTYKIYYKRNSNANSGSVQQVNMILMETAV